MTPFETIAEHLRKTSNISLSSEQLQQFANDDNLLEETRKVRLAILHTQIKDGIPSDKDGFEQLHKNLVELDKVALQNKRIAVDSDSNNVNAALIDKISESLIGNIGKRDIFEKDPETSGASIPTPLAIDEIDIELVPGELESGISNLNYKEFMKNEGKEIEEQIRDGKLSLSQIE